MVFLWNHIMYCHTVYFFFHMLYFCAFFISCLLWVWFAHLLGNVLHLNPLNNVDCLFLSVSVSLGNWTVLRERKSLLLIDSYWIKAEMDRLRSDFTIFTLWFLTFFFFTCILVKNVFLSHFNHFNGLLSWHTYTLSQQQGADSDWFQQGHCMPFNFSTD